MEQSSELRFQDSGLKAQCPDVKTAYMAVSFDIKTIKPKQ
jgi:hypothetical protein